MKFDAHHLPQVDQECSDQIRNKWVAAPGANTYMPVAGSVPIKPKRADTCSRSNSNRRVADMLALR